MNVRSTKTAFTLVELLVVIAILAVLIALLLPAVQMAREAARRMHCSNNAKQIALSMQSYHDIHHELPAGRRKTPTEHSWAPFLLPYMEEADLYRIYDFDVDWNHANNNQAIATQVDTFICPSSPAAYTRSTNVGSVKASISDYAAVPSIQQSLINAGFVDARKNIKGALGDGESNSFADITDGLSNTLVVVEDAGRPDFWIGQKKGPNTPVFDDGGNIVVNNGIVGGSCWGDGQNVVPTHGMTSDGLSSPGPCPFNCSNNNEAYGFHPGGLVVGICDGSVQVFTESMHINVYASWVTKAGEDTFEEH